MKVDELVDIILREKGLYQRFKEAEVPSVWKEVVGGLIASRTRSVKMYNGTLFVTMSSSVVRQELEMVKEGLLSALNDKLGEKVIKEIVIR